MKQPLADLAATLIQPRADQLVRVKGLSETNVVHVKGHIKLVVIMLEQQCATFDTLDAHGLTNLHWHCSRPEQT